jgi:indole-3-glycerol phosphate synthase
MNFLETILTEKRRDVALRKRTLLRARLEEMPAFAAERRSLVRALCGTDMAIVAEIGGGPPQPPPGSPATPRALAERCVRKGARAVAVVTDERFFQGTLDTLETVRWGVAVPVLRRDFIVDRYQLYEARAYGADAVPLIAAALEPPELSALAEESRLLGLEVVVEVHTEEEIERLDLSLIDVVALDNRDPNTFEADPCTSVRLRKQIPQSTPVLSQHGIRTGRDLRLLLDNDIHAVLIAGRVMDANDTGRLLHAHCDEA